MSIESQHAKNEWLFCSRGKDIVVDMIVVGMWLGRKKKKFIQFVAIFWLLNQGCIMTDFEAMKLLFEFLKVMHIPKKH
jgi:hypothetical protein